MNSAIVSVILASALVLLSLTSAQESSSTLHGSAFMRTEVTPEILERLQRAGEAHDQKLSDEILRSIPATIAAPKVSIVLQNNQLKRTALTDTVGKFEFKDLPLGSYEVHAFPGDDPSRMIAIDPQRVEFSGNGPELKIKVDLDAVIIRGKITDSDGRPIARAWIRGELSPAAPQEVMEHYFPTRKALTRSDGTYELQGLATRDAWIIAGYLNGGDPTADGHPFYVEVRVTADGWAQESTPKVPLVTEALLKRARELLKILQAAKRKRDPSFQIGERKVLLPSSVGHVITGIDIVVRPPTAEERKRAEAKVPTQQFKATIESKRAFIAAETAARKERMNQRFERDRQTYSDEQRREIESIYQSANRNLKDPKATEILKMLIEKFPKANRTGCAVQYLGQISEGEEKEKYLKLAIRDYSDCYFGSGVQVGAYARLYLSDYYRKQGRVDDAKSLYEEIRKDFPDAVNHQGKPLIDFIPR